MNRMLWTLFGLMGLVMSAGAQDVPAPDPLLDAPAASATPAAPPRRVARS